jgi:hypothetical protein
MAKETTSCNDAGLAERLQNMVLDSADVEEFLEELAGFPLPASPVPTTR